MTILFLEQHFNKGRNYVGYHFFPKKNEVHKRKILILDGISMVIFIVLGLLTENIFEAFFCSNFFSSFFILLSLIPWSNMFYTAIKWARDNNKVVIAIFLSILFCIYSVPVIILFGFTLIVLF